MEHFSIEKAKDNKYDWKSPPMHTHFNGYRFCIGVDINGQGGCNREGAIGLQIYAIKGRSDSTLNWPAWMRFTVEILNHAGGKNAQTTFTFSNWTKLEVEAPGMAPRTSDDCHLCHFVELGSLDDYLLHDTLFFYVSNVVVVA